MWQRQNGINLSPVDTADGLMPQALFSHRFSGGLFFTPRDQSHQPIFDRLISAQKQDERLYVEE